MFALVDGNSFYAACEQVFRPDLAGRPIVVLSNNDGCVVAANKQAKSIGDIMYQPYFQLEKMLAQHGTTVFSSNYELYGDLSHRMHTLLGSYAIEQEVYSIDECFLDFSGMQHYDLTAYGQEIKQTVMKQLSLPVAVGIGKSKTLAKAANNLAKKIDGLAGVLSISELPEAEQNQLLSRMSVADVWGVGRQWSKRLRATGIETALDLKQCAPKKIRQQYNVILERTVHELNGIPCQDLELIQPDKKEIVSSRSFSKSITEYLVMKQAVSRYVARAAEKLRGQKGVYKQISVGINTNPFKHNTVQYRNLGSTTLIYPSNHKN
jgi:DNA polymerase V